MTKADASQVDNVRIRGAIEIVMNEREKRVGIEIVKPNEAAIETVVGIITPNESGLKTRNEETWNVNVMSIDGQIDLQINALRGCANSFRKEDAETAQIVGSDMKARKNLNVDGSDVEIDRNRHPLRNGVRKQRGWMMVRQQQTNEKLARAKLFSLMIKA